MTMEIKMETVVKRFRDYISFNTQSDEANDKECPSTWLTSFGPSASRR